MIQFVNSHIPLKGFSCMYLFGILFIRKGSNVSAYTINHESIHQQQAREMLYIIFYLWYAVEWLIRFIRSGNARQAYYDISLEREAYYNMFDLDYTDWRRHYAWTQYL